MNEPLIEDINREVESQELGQKDLGKKLAEHRELFSAPMMLECFSFVKGNRKELADLIRDRYSIAHFFSDFLKRIMKRRNPTFDPMEDQTTDPLLQTLQYNLSEELGKISYEAGNKNHSQGRRDLLHILLREYQPWNYDVWEKGNGTLDEIGSQLPEPCRILIERYRNIIDEDSFVGAALLCAHEGRVAYEYENYLKLLEGAFPRYIRSHADYPNDHPFWHIAAHAKRDEGHEQELMDALKQSATSNDDTEKISKGYALSNEIWTEYWGNTAKAMIQKSEAQIQRVMKVLEQSYGVAIQKLAHSNKKLASSLLNKVDEIHRRFANGEELYEWFRIGVISPISTIEDIVDPDFYRCHSACYFLEHEQKRLQKLKAGTKNNFQIGRAEIEELCTEMKDSMDIALNKP